MITQHNLITFKSINDLSDFLFSNTERFYFTPVHDMQGNLMAFKIKYKFSPEIKWTTITSTAVFTLNEQNKLILLHK